ncbi:MAG: GHKL domain-containing protein [Sporomusaceae bacterium]|nr:GHKL domain-containing protein [Sporomusaceae bacterium]
MIKTCALFLAIVWKTLLKPAVKMPQDQLRYIDINTTIAKNHLVIKIANSFYGSVLRQGDSFVSSKDGDDHGMGLASVKALTSKYHGYCSIYCEQQVFKVAVFLQLPETVAESRSFSIP